MITKARRQPPTFYKLAEREEVKGNLRLLRHGRQLPALSAAAIQRQRQILSRRDSIIATI